MDCITAPIAGTPAKFTWRRRVDADVVRTELEASDDARMRAGVLAAVEHISGRHGLPQAEQHGFADEVDTECKRALAADGRHECCCRVVIEERGDRVEVRIRRADAASHLAAETHNGNGSRAQVSPSDGKTLVKHFHKNPAPSRS